LHGGVVAVVVGGLAGEEEGVRQRLGKLGGSVGAAD